jgi:hypothetical protein
LIRTSASASGFVASPMTSYPPQLPKHPDGKAAASLAPAARQCAPLGVQGTRALITAVEVRREQRSLAEDGGIGPHTWARARRLRRDPFLTHYSPRASSLVIRGCA